MFPEELMKIISKHKSNNQNHIRNIYENLCEIIKSLKGVQNNLASELFEINKSDDIIDSTELQNDIKSLKEQIAYIKSFTSNQSVVIEVDESINSHTEEISEEIAPTFEKKVYPYLISDDLCCFCGVKLIPHYIYYNRIINNKIHQESIVGYRCPACNRLFLLDCDIENFDFDNTNIVLNTDKYFEIPPINIHTAIVLSNTLKCSSEHTTKDIIAKIPVINEEGELSYYDITASYCFTCKRFTILKDDFNSINGIIMCSVIDETTESTPKNSNNEIEITQKNSLLYNYGYNVKTKENLSDKQRHTILGSVIEAGIMNRRDIINHLNSLIARGSKIESWKLATQKWTQDKEYVYYYQNGSLPEVIMDEVILRYSKSVQ